MLKTALISSTFTRCVTRRTQTVLRSQYHYAVDAKFVFTGARGETSTEGFKAWLGTETSTCVLLPGRIGKAFQKGIIASAGAAIRSAPDRLPLIFDHDTCTFVSPSTPLPRIILPVNLPRQTDSPHTPSTLFIYDVGDMITFDGTEDAEFAAHSQDSAKELRPVLEKLKDM
ncbi:hypothetical protein BDZ85DRAFT_63331 [Elsinoe ampelina]|uniref:Uncharacterized protein n=1 Tax=Elsinoe ampelina TaxID=302913 RepID=A0A6A6FZI5_9PEZI|nr:hypothetical protein BDZ85DRAFT_63331 [Elsinoe ampelina]